MPPGPSTPAPAFLFAPGAGAPSTSPWMRAWAERLGGLGPVHPFDYPYMLAGRKSPDRQPVLERAHRQALAEAQAAASTQPGGRAVSWFLAGKSMGSRIGCHVAAASPELVRGLICFGYPLVAGGTGAVRDEVLLALRLPILFVQGTRDPLCPLDRLRAVCERMTAPVQIIEVTGGNHSLELGRGKSSAAAAAQRDADATIVGEVERFVARVAGPVAPLLA
jgi:predicted alpha/beta-hydrolase family hydrolase